MRNYEDVKTMILVRYFQALANEKNQKDDWERGYYTGIRQGIYTAISALLLEEYWYPSKYREIDLDDYLLLEMERLYNFKSRGSDL